MYFSIQMTLQKKKPPPIIAFLAVAANQTALFRICNWQQQKGCLACWQKAQSRLFSGICFFPFLLTKQFGWIPEMSKHVFSLLLAKDSLYVTYALLGCPFFFFRELRIYLCLVFSFLLFHSHLFPSAFGGFWIWLQTRKPVLSWVMFSFCFYIILRSLIVFPC